MDPVTIMLMAASAAGAILGSKRKYLDPNWLRENFGPEVVTQETTKLVDGILNSPKGQEIINSAATQGQQLTSQIKAHIARAGGGVTGDSLSGNDLFTGAAAEGASNTAVNQAKAGIWQAAMPIAQQMVSDRMGALLGDRANNGVSDPSAHLGLNSGQWQALGNAAGLALTAKSDPAKKTKTSTPNAQSPPPTGATGGYGLPGSDYADLAAPNVFAASRPKLGLSRRAARGMRAGASRFAHAVVPRW